MDKKRWIFQKNDIHPTLVGTQWSFEGMVELKFKKKKNPRGWWYAHV